MWSPLKLKLEETSYFADQIAAHRRHPKQFLFHLFAFLSSARTVSFHLQKQFASQGRDIYERLRDELLSDDVARYFLEARNFAEKEGYPPVAVGQVVAYENTETKALAWTMYAQTVLFGEQGSDAGFDRLEKMMKYDWEAMSIVHPPAHINYVWTFPDFPTGSVEVGQACQDFAARLWRFVAKFRAEWELVHDRRALFEKMEISEKLLFDEL